MYQPEAHWSRGIEPDLTNIVTDVPSLFADEPSPLTTHSPDVQEIFLSPVPDLHYHRRFSTMSAASDDSRGDRRLLTPEDSPQPPHDVKREGGENKVQLPSIYATFDEPFRQDLSRRMSLPTDSLGRPKSQSSLDSRPSGPYGTSHLSGYIFPPQQPDGAHPEDRPRVDTQLSSAVSSYGNSSYPSATTTSSAGYYSSPLSSEPGSLAPPSNGQMFNGTRISGHADRRSSMPEASGGLKPEASWNFSQAEYGHNPEPSPTVALPEATPVNSSRPAAGTVSPSLANAPSLVERPPRKRGKLPKHVTDFLKDWLHRHADHPYPSEEEKKQLCHTTGLSMSQVSNWMINARRRILAPAQRAAAQAAANSPYGNRSASMTASLIDQGRRNSMPTSTMADSMQLHYPPHMASVPGYAQDYLPGQRPMLSIPRGSYPVDYGHRVSYAPPMHNPAGHYVPSGVPMSAPPTMPATPFGNGYPNGQVYAQGPYRTDSASRGYYAPPPATGSPPAGGNAAPHSGNGYSTPQ